MKNIVLILIIIIISFTLIFAQDDQSNSKESKRALSYQSMIKDSLGNSIEDGKYLITFRLYDSENSNDPIWFENQNVYVNDGILNVLLGNKKRLSPKMFMNPLWVTLEMDKEESDKQYVSATSYSMYSGLVDLDAFAPSEDVHLSLDPDGRIVIDITPIPPSPDLLTKSLTFGNTSNNLSTGLKLGEYLTMNNKYGIQIGSFMHNIASDWYKGGDDFDDFVIYAKEGRDLVLKSDVVGGDVYIGTEATPNNLTVTGGLKAPMLTFGNQYSAYDFTSMYNQFGTYIGGLMYNYSGTAYKGGDDFDDLVLYTRDGDDLVLMTSKDSENNAGNVFIGTEATPNDLYVYGKLIATEVEVKLDVFPDYVFKDDYNLLTLSEVEDHINFHGRLPGMPSEEEVVENGLNLNEMQLKVVEKIEELTLHMIRLEKENNELRARLNSITD